MLSLDQLDEHFGYVSDTRKLALFREAIFSTVKPGDHVIDLGCGTGVLGLFCLEAGARHVTFVDQADMIDIARETMLRAGYGGSSTFIRGNSENVTPSERADVIVSDHLGYFGVDYGVLATLKNVASRLLRPDGRMLPSTLILKAALFELDSPPVPMRRWQSDSIPPEFHWLSEFSANMKLPLDISGGALLTDPVELTSFHLGADDIEFVDWKKDVRPVRRGTAMGLVGWFETELVDGLCMTNAPFDRKRIRRAPAVFPFAQALTVETDQTVNLEILGRPQDHIWSWKVVTNNGRDVRTQSTWNTVTPTLKQAASQPETENR